jgi:adenine nucleotide transporter 17
LYFYAYSLLRYLALRRRARSAIASDKSTTAAQAQVLPVALELALGFVAGVASRAVSTPLSVITVRLQTESSGEPASDEDKDQKRSQPTANVNRKRATALTVLQSIYDSDGLAGFWKGQSSFLRIC